MMTSQIWGIAARLLAGIYVIAFVSIRKELVALAGSRGISPLAEKLGRIRQDMGRTGWVRYPTWFWLSASDGALRRLPAIGILTALLAACGVFSNVMFVATWSLYLSCDTALGMTYPWESMLFETGFLAMFLPRLNLLPSLAMAHPPEPILMFAFEWLLFRVLFGFGKIKFSREALKDPMYLRSFLISQPMVSPLGWSAVRLPRFLMMVPHFGLFFTEIALPFLIFFPGWPRLTSAAGITVLMIAIQLMGNFGFFNMLVVVLCVTLLDQRSITEQTVADLGSPRGLVVAVAVTWSVIAGLIHLPFNTWCARTWLNWPAWAKVRGAGGALLAVLRGAMPFRTVHAYGVFPPRLGPPVRFLPVVEGTIDGEHWEPFQYRYQPTTEKSPPRFVAPHCPRIDHMILYEGYGVNAGNFLGTVFGHGNPYDFSSVSMMDRLLERLMDPASPVCQLFAAVPFNGVTPKRVRVNLYVFAPTTRGEMKITGRYWRRTWVSEHMRERGPDPTIFSRWLPAPEQFHPDELWSRRLVPRLRPLPNARDFAGVQTVLRQPERNMWRVFWDEFIPTAAAAAKKGWPEVDELAQWSMCRYGSAALEQLDAIRGALTVAIVGRVEPDLKVRSYFHAYLVAHVLLLHGEKETEEALQTGTCLLTESEIEIESEGLMVFTLFRRDMMHLHARKQRLADRTLPPTTPPPQVIPGFTFTTAVLARGLPDGLERIPEVEQCPDGEWLMGGVSIL
jgi:hypothetical protein